VPLEETIRGFAEILDGKHDDLPEDAFYMVGTIDEALERAAALKGEEKAADAPAANAPAANATATAATQDEAPAADATATAATPDKAPAADAETDPATPGEAAKE
jgi:hypothetical protein